MRYFLDTEFIASGTSLDLLSVGIVAGDGREFYRENAYANTAKANDWVRANVFPYLNFGDPDICLTHDEMRSQLRDFIGDDSSPEFWGWCCGLDYAALCLLFGLDNWPESWGYYFHDIQALADENDIELTAANQEGQPDQHNALADARWIKRLYEHMVPPAHRRSP